MEELHKFLQKDTPVETKYLQIEKDRIKVMYSKKSGEEELYFITWIDKQ